MAIRKRFATVDQERTRDELGKFAKLEADQEELKSQSNKVSWCEKNNNTYYRREVEKLDFDTMFIYASIIAIIIFK